MQIPHRAFLRIARIGATRARRIGLHGAQLLRDGLRILAQPDGVAVGLGHLAAVEARHLGRRGQQHLRLGQDADAGAFQIAEQPLAVGHRNAVVALHQLPRALQRVGIAGLLELAAQLLVER